MTMSGSNTKSMILDPDLHWSNRLEPPKLPQSGEVHLWWIELDQMQLPETEVWQMLYPDEQQRARRFRFAVDRHRFIARRVIRKKILGKYLGCPAENVPIVETEAGQPKLCSRRGKTRLEFSASHSSGMAVVAVCAHGRIGVDVERIRPVPESSLIAESHFAASEYRRFRDSREGDRDELFMSIWTGKEAFVKATGDGLSFPLSQVEIKFSGGETEAVTVDNARSDLGQSWFINSSKPHPAFKVATVVDTPLTMVTWRQW